MTNYCNPFFEFPFSLDEPMQHPRRCSLSPHFSPQLTLTNMSAAVPNLACRPLLYTLSKHPERS